MLAKEKAEEELRELSDTVEMATLDKEMAEERVSGEKREEREGGSYSVYLMSRLVT